MNKKFVFTEDDLRGVYKTNVPEINIDDLPNPMYNVKRRATHNETIILKACKKKGKITSSWVRDYLELPDRTSSFVLSNLERQKLVKSEWKMVVASDGRRHNSKVFSLVDNGTKKDTGKNRGNKKGIKRSGRPGKRPVGRKRGTSKGV